MKCARCGKAMYEDMDSNRWLCESSGCESIFWSMTSDSGTCPKCGEQSMYVDTGKTGSTPFCVSSKCKPPGGVFACDDPGKVKKVSGGTALSDSGTKETFPSGYHRDSRKGKGRYDLIPPRPIHLLACVFEDGGAKHGDRNWEKGGEVGSFIDCAKRHIAKYEANMRVQPHMTQAIWNLITGLEMAIRVDDISKYERERLAKFEEEDK